jgi:hypothetical protein
LSLEGRGVYRDYRKMMIELHSCMFEFKVPLERDLAGEMLVVYGEN